MRWPRSQGIAVFTAAFALAAAGVAAPAWAAPAPPPAAAPPAAATQAEEAARFEARLMTDLAARSRAAAALFAQANRLRDAGNHAAAADLYGRVWRLAPGFVHALRRQGYEELAQGHRRRALGLLRQAVSRDASAENLSALASTLGRKTPEGAPAPGDLDEAETLSRQAVTLAPRSYGAWAQRFYVVQARGDVPGVIAVAEHMRQLGPDQPATWVVTSLATAAQGRWRASDEALGRARALGLPEASFRELDADLERHRPWYWHLLPLWWLPALWVAVMPVLFVCGWVLSLVTAAQAKSPAQVAGSPHGLRLALRRAYRGVLWLSCVYYWLSLPLILLLVIAAGGGVIYGLFAFGHVPVQIVVAVLSVTVVTVVAMFKSVFARRRQDAPGPVLDLARQPRFSAVLHEVAQRIGTRVVDTVYLAPGTELAVMERGDLGRQLRGAPERCLILGLGVLEGMRLRSFKAVLAHEYGHFSNRDTAGGGFALAVRNSLLTMGAGLARGGAATWYSPAWLFVRGFTSGFLRISQGASRLQEVLADRWAAAAYGSAAFESGLRHVIDRAVRFDAHVSASLTELAQKKLPLANLYAMRPAKAPDGQVLARQVESSFRRQPSPYDSHPAPADRVRWVEGLGAAGGPPAADDDEPVWSLLADREALERQLTAEVRRRLAVTRGLYFPDGEPKAKPAAPVPA